MDLQLKKMPQKLIALDKKAEELSNTLQDVRVEISNLLWDFIELKNNKLKPREHKLT